jgi:CMP-2-keto-3-deoxyoctulosonic acid synthetase
VNDTPPEVAAEFDALMVQRSGSDRVRMACEMFDLARRLAVAGIRADEPTITDTHLRVRLFERLYGDEFSEESRARIVATLR